MNDKERAEEYYEDNECYSYLAEVEDFEEVFGFVKDRVIHAYLDGLAEGRKENAEIKTELMHLKGCKECKDRPRGELATVCPTEYEQHCIGQKMVYIKELETENKDLCKSLDIMNNRESDLLDQIQKMKCCGNCSYLRVDYDDRYCEHNATSTKVCKNYSEWELAE